MTFWVFLDFKGLAQSAREELSGGVQVQGTIGGWSRPLAGGRRAAQTPLQSRTPPSLKLKAPSEYRTLPTRDLEGFWGGVKKKVNRQTIPCPLQAMSRAAVSPAGGKNHHVGVLQCKRHEAPDLLFVGPKQMYGGGQCQGAHINQQTKG